MKRNTIIAFILFLGLLALVAAGIFWNIRLVQELGSLDFLNIVGIIRDILVISLFGVLVVETGLFED
ncbi:MAG: hypothetical protein ACFFER_12930 [Candidatus Thorarchaeota archaeon]